MSLSFHIYIYIYIYILVGWWTEPDMYVTFMIYSLDGTPYLTNYFIRMGPKGYSVNYDHYWRLLSSRKHKHLIFFSNYGV